MQSFQALTGGLAPRVKVVDIGANPIDSEPPYAGMLRAGLAEVVGFEPNPAALAVLESRKGPLERYFPHAVGDGARHAATSQWPRDQPAQHFGVAGTQWPAHRGAAAFSQWPLAADRPRDWPDRCVA